MPIYDSLGILGIFWSHLEEGIGHGSFVPTFRVFHRENESLAFVKMNFDKPSLQKVPPMSIFESLGIHGIFWSHLEEGIGHGSFVPTFRVFHRENESLAFVTMNFDKPSPS